MPAPRMRRGEVSGEGEDEEVVVVVGRAIVDAPVWNCWGPCGLGRLASGFHCEMDGGLPFRDLSCLWNLVRS